METEKKGPSSAYSSFQETLKKQAELLQNRPGTSFIPATSVSIFSLLKAVFEARGTTRIPAILSQQQPKPFSGGLIGPSSPIVLLGVSGVFALSSYSISQDISNGPSTATGNSSFLYSVQLLIAHIISLKLGVSLTWPCLESLRFSREGQRQSC